jgi:hypothetical protein
VSELIFRIADLPPKIAARITIHPVSGCWLWSGVQNGRGYGQVHWNDRMRYVHRVAYELLAGSIGEGLELDHVADRGCAFKHCCNPAHLEPVTHRENMRRALETSECPAGHQRRASGKACLVCKRERAGWKGGLPMAQRTHCPYGHEYTPENTRFTSKGGRFCAECRRIRDHERYLAKRSFPAAIASQ